MKSTFLGLISVLAVVPSSCTTPTQQVQSHPQTPTPSAPDMVSPAVKAP
jgi:hypothetical protein